MIGEEHWKMSGYFLVKFKIESGPDDDDFCFSVAVEFADEPDVKGCLYVPKGLFHSRTLLVSCLKKILRAKGVNILRKLI